MLANYHEEAESRTCLHVGDALNEATPIVFRTVDLDVVVILVGVSCTFPAPSRTTDIVGFGTGKDFRYYINPIPR